MKRNHDGIRISCKIRLLKNEKKMNELLGIIGKCHIDRLCIHARYIDDRSHKIEPRIKVLNNALRNSNLYSNKNNDIHIIYNGNVFEYNDFNKY